MSQPTGNKLDHLNPSLRMAARQALRANDSYLINPIFPNGAFHCISGPPDIGKSTWLFQLLHQLWNGNVAKLLGEGCTVGKEHRNWIYVSSDRGLRDTDRTLARLGLSDWNAPVYAQEEISKRMNQGMIGAADIFKLVQMFPDATTFFIEGLQAYLPDQGRGQSLNKAQSVWNMQVRDLITNRGIIIVAVTHSPKNSNPSHDREDMLGSQGLIGGLGTIILLNTPLDGQGMRKKTTGPAQSDERLVTILPKNSPPMFLDYTRDPSNGAFVLSAKQVGGSSAKTAELIATPSDQHFLLDAHLGAFEGQAELTLRQINSWARSSGITDDTLKGWLGEQVRVGKLLQEGVGKYRRSQVQ